MDRLTGKNNDYCFFTCGDRNTLIREDCNLYNVCYERKMYEKLKRYEDLEEAGRLVILSEGFDREKYIPRIARAFTRVFCPREFGLIDKQCDEWQPESVLLCYKCWEAALKGAGDSDG